MSYKISKDELQKYLEDGLSTRKIAEITGYGKTMIGYLVDKYDLTDYLKFKKLPNYKINKIDSKEKAYLLGFVACDGSINENGSVEVSVCKADKEVVEFLGKIVGSKVIIDDTFNKKQRRFPRARIIKKITDIQTFVGGCKKSDRHFPIANSELERYVLLGAFDADGCLTWGRRKDKNRLWYKISFTSSLKIVTGIQQFLLKRLDISTAIHPKTGESDCFVVEFSNKNDVLKFLDYIYQDNFIVLKRKYLKSNALRLELGENGEDAFKQ